MWKITLFFTMGTQSWTETYYIGGSPSVPPTVSTLNGLNQVRAALNGPQTSIVAVRIVHTSNPRIAIPYPGGFFGPYPGTFTSIPGTDPDQDSAPAFVAAQVKFQGMAGNICRRYLGGMPEGLVSSKLNQTTYVGVLGAWNNALLSFVSFISGLLSFRYTNQAGIQVCQGVLTSAQFPGEIGVQFGAAVHSGPGPWRIHLKGFRKVNYRQFGLGGNYLIDPKSPAFTAVAAPYIYYLQNTPNVQVSNISTLGSGVQLTYGFDLFNVNTFSLLSFRHRKRGVSALAPRGRLRSKP